MVMTQTLGAPARKEVTPWPAIPHSRPHMSSVQPCHLPAAPSAETPTSAARLSRDPREAWGKVGARQAEREELRSVPILDRF